MCFPTDDRVREVKGDQITTRECYVASLKGKEIKETLVIDDMEGRDDIQMK